MPRFYTASAGEKLAEVQPTVTQHRGAMFAVSGDYLFFCSVELSKLYFPTPAIQKFLYNSLTC